MRHLSRVYGVAVVIMIALTLPAVALAHATFVRSTPAPNAVVSSAPSVIRAVFSEALAADGSVLTVTGPGGIRVDQGDSRIDPADPAGATMVVSLRAGMQAGRYVVNWVAVSARDGHRESGSFAFTVASASGAPAMPRTGGGKLLPVLSAITLALGGWVIRRIGRGEAIRDSEVRAA